MGTPWAFNLLNPRTQMQTPTKMDEVANED